MSDDKSLDQECPGQPETAGTDKAMRRRQVLARLTRTVIIGVPVTLGIMSMTRSAHAS